MRKILNLEYSCIHGTYWMFYGVVSSFASVYLLAQGYSNWNIGIILAVANVLAVALQPIVADIADRSKRLSIIGISEILTCIMMIATAGLFAISGKNIALSVIFILLIAWHSVLRPLFNSLTFVLEQTGIHINFGISRSMGSLCYAALVAVLGTLVEKYGVVILPITGEIILVMLLLSLVLTGMSYKKGMKKKQLLSDSFDNTIDDISSVKGEEEINLINFIRRNKLFFIVNLGVIGLYYSNSILNNYMIQIVDMVGGNSEDMGRILSVMAFCEIPTMVCFDMLRKKFSCQLMIKVASIGFTLKILLCAIANSVTMVFIAQFIQMIAFALFLPAMVHFIDEIMSKGEAVKGQALFTTMVTVTTVISSITGGAILDISGARTLAVISTIATAIGAIIIIVSVGKIKTK